MIFLLLDFLKDTFPFKIPLAFDYVSTRMMLASITSLTLTIFFGPFFIKKLYQMKIGQTIRMDECPLLGQLHYKKKDTPTMGGALILFAMLISMLLWMNLKNVFSLILFITTLVLGLLGAWDDYLKLKYKNAKGLSARKKMFIQILLGSFIALYLLCPQVSETLEMGSWFSVPVIKENARNKIGKEGAEKEKIAKERSAVTSHTRHPQEALTLKEYASRLYIPFFKDYVVSFKGLAVIFSGLLIIFVVCGASNAVNLTDGLDGLAAGCLIMVGFCLALIAFVSNNVDLASYLNILYIEGSGEIAVYLSALIGACIGFLWYNGHPAQVFMGDTGSLALGGVIGVSSVLLKKEMLLGLVGGVFVAEAFSVIIQVASYKLRNKKRVFLCAPLHHHFEYKGWPETKVVIRFWIVSLLLALIGLASLKFQ